MYLLGPPFGPLQDPSVQALAHQLSLSPPGGELQKPQSEPGGVPGEHEEAAHDRGLQVEHKADCPLGPGQLQGCWWLHKRVVVPGAVLDTG